MTSPYTAVNEVRTTHTPGPWTDGRDVPVRGHSEIGLGLCYIAATDPGSLSDLEARANARLIAAAPDHALICWALCVASGRWEPSSNGGEFCINGIRYSTKLDEFGCPVVNGPIRAAILKAQGTQS